MLAENFKPESYSSLAHLRRLDIKLTGFDRLLMIHIPICGEIPVFNVNASLTDQVISEYMVMVPQADFNHRAAWEVTSK
jgi:hypothetical protein